MRIHTLTIQNAIVFKLISPKIVGGRQKCGGGQKCEKMSKDHVRFIIKAILNHNLNTLLIFENLKTFGRKCTKIWRKF